MYLYIIEITKETLTTMTTTTIFHSKFGKGEIIEITNDKVIIDFEEVGEKSLLKNHVTLYATEEDMEASIMAIEISKLEKEEEAKLENKLPEVNLIFDGVNYGSDMSSYNAARSRKMMQIR